MNGISTIPCLNVNSTIFKQQLTNISAVLNNTGNTTKLLTSFNALDLAQQKVLLSSKLLTEEQKAQCLTMATLSSANAKYTTEQIAKATGLSAETLANWGLVESTDALTLSQLAELASSDAQAKSALDKIVAQNAQAVANGEVTASNVALATSEGGVTLATGAFTTAIKANIKAMWIWMTTTPIGWLTLLAGGIASVIGLYDLLTTSVKEQKEKMEDSLSAYEDTKTELSNITTELENQEQAMNELLAKEKLTYAEKGQLEELQAITQELRIQKDLAEKETDRTQKQAAQDASDLFDKQFGEYDISESKINSHLNDFNLLGTLGNELNLMADEDNISSMIAAYKIYNEELEKAYGSGTKEDIDNIKDVMGYVEDSLFSTAQELQNQQSAMSDYYNTIKDTPYDELTISDQEIVDNYKAISNAIQLIYQQLDPNSWNSMQVDEIFSTDGIEKTKDELVEMAKSGELTPDTIKGYANLNKALGETTLSAEGLCEEMYAIAKAEKEVQGSTLDNEIDVSFSDIFALEDAEGELTNLGEISESIDKIQNAYKTLSGAIEEYNETGHFSIDTIQSITELGSGYLDYLIDEEGNIRLDQEALQTLTIARLQDMQAQMQQELLSQIDNIKSEGDAALFAAQCYREEAEGINMVTEAMLKNRVANLNISDSAKQQVLDSALKTYNQINAMFDNAISGVMTNPNAIIGGGGSGGDSSSSKYYDWIETRLNRIQILIDRCTKSVEQFSDADMKNTGVDVLISGTEKLQSNAEAAYDKYMQLANDVALSDDLKALVRDGAIDVANIQNEEISEAIDEYQKYFEAAEDLKGQLEDINIELGELHIQKLDNVIDDICEGLGYANEQMDNLLGLMDDLADYDGTELTSGGLSKGFLYNQQMENSIKQAEKYNQIIEELNRLYKDGKITQAQYTEKFQEYQSAQNSAVASVKEYENAIVDLIKNGIQAEIDAFDELTQKKIDALNADKKQADYADSVAEKQRNIANLEKQISQLTLSTDRSDTAKRLQLQEELADVRKDLTDEQAEHNLETTIDSLEAENEAYASAKTKEQELLDNDLTYRNEAIAGFLDNVESEYGSIYATLDMYAQNYNLNLTQQLTTPWQYGVTAVESYANALNTLSNISVPDFASLFNAGSGGKENPTPPTYQNKWKIVDKNGKDLYVGFDSEAEALEYKKKYIRKDSAYNTYKIKYYAKGTSSAKRGLSLVSEHDKYEAMLANGTLISLKGGETIFNNDATKTLYDFANDPEKFVSNLNMSLVPKLTLPDIPKKSTDMVINHSSNFVINGHMNDTEKKELTNLIDGQIDKTFKKIQGKYYR